MQTKIALQKSYICKNLVSVLVLAIFLSNTPAFAGTQCKQDYVVGVGVPSYSLKFAKKKAKWHWQRTSRLMHGWKYDDWDDAKKIYGDGFYCKQIKQFLPDEADSPEAKSLKNRALHQCYAAAYPCTK